MKRLTLLAILLLIPSLAPAKPTSSDTLAAELDRMFQEAYPADEPGASVIVVQGGKTLLRKGYGLAELEHGIPIEPDMVFRLGSITKQFTAVAIMLLAEEGKLSVTDEVTRFLPDYPTHGAKVTVEHLMTHTSGIPNYTAIPGFMTDVRDDRGVEEMIDVFKDLPLEFEPGTKWAYSNSGYFLLGAIVEKASGQGYAEFVRQRIFEPLGMTRTYYGSNSRLIPDRARGYHKDGEDYVNAPYVSMSIPYAAGSLLSTVDDLARWHDALTDGEILPHEAVERMWTNYKLADGKAAGYGYGWSVGEAEGEPVIHHGGGIHGFSTMGIHLPAEDTYVAVLSNNPQGPNPGGLAQRAAMILSGGDADPEAVEVPAETLERYAGVYRINDSESRVVTVKDGRLYTQRSGGARLEAKLSSPTELFYEDSLTRGRFELDDDGTVKGMTMVAWAGPQEFAELTDEAIPEGPKMAEVDPAVYDAYEGEYELMPNFVLTVRRDGDRLVTQATGQPEIEIFPESETDFFNETIGATLSFVRDEAGEVSSLVLRQGGQEITGKRLK